mmetsp:Transcript_37303/g.81241  ORF Transcript_37303/g.81241 Transcript_37303/m.81241 type:complete len:226 (-) Transcript_37303:377-1054(-)
MLELPPPRLHPVLLGTMGWFLCRAQLLLLLVRVLLLLFQSLSQLRTLDEELSAQGERGRGHLLHLPGAEEFDVLNPEDLDERFGHGVLLRDAAVVLQRQDQGQVGLVEGELLDGLDHIGKLELRRQREAVVHNRHPVLSVPAVDLHASAARLQRRLVAEQRALGPELVPGEVRVVRGADEIVVQRALQLLVVLFVVVELPGVDGAVLYIRQQQPEGEVYVLQHLL